METQPLDARKENLSAPVEAWRPRSLVRAAQAAAAAGVLHEAATAAARRPKSRQGRPSVDAATRDASACVGGASRRRPGDTLECRSASRVGQFAVVGVGVPV